MIAFALKCIKTHFYLSKRLLWEQIFTNNQMKFNVLQKKKNNGKTLAVVKLIIVNCNFDLPEEKPRRLCQKQDG